MNRTKRRLDASKLGLPADFASALDEVGRLQDEFAAARAEIAETTRTVTSGPVTAIVNGAGRLISLTVDPSMGAQGTLITQSAASAVLAAQDAAAAFAAEKMAPYAALGQDLE